MIISELPMPLIPYFERDGVTIYHADCREVLPSLQSETIDMVLTDPPYLVSYDGRWGSDWGVIQGDTDPAWVAPVFAELWRLLRPDSLCLSFYGRPHADTFLNAWKTVGFRPVSLLVLVKDRWGLGHFSRNQHEPAYLLAKGHPSKPAAAISDVLSWERPNPQFHPNQKPLGAISKLISTYTAAEANVLDPFCGSGTTLVAARALGRRAIGIEIEERFCELAALRLSQQLLDLTDGSGSPQQLTFASSDGDGVG